MTLFTDTRDYCRMVQPQHFLPNDAMRMLGNPIGSSRNHVKVWGSRTRGRSQTEGVAGSGKYIPDANREIR
jgi:hypothetical protein